MDIKELRRLLPFYIAGTLNTGERNAVEDGLRESAELRAELGEWKEIQQVVKARAGYEEAHVPASGLIEFAAGSLGGPDRQRIAAHIESCASCKTELDILRETFEKSDAAAALQSAPIPGPGFFSALVSKLKARRIQLGFAIAVVAIASIVFLMRQGSGPTQNSQILDLHYSPEVRGGETRPVPEIFIDQRIKQVVMHVGIPSSGIPATRYLLTLRRPSLLSEELADKLPGEPAGGEHTIISLTTAASHFLDSGRYELTVKEEFDHPPGGIQPSTYLIPFNISPDH